MSNVFYSSMSISQIYGITTIRTSYTVKYDPPSSGFNPYYVADTVTTKSTDQGAPGIRYTSRDSVKTPNYRFLRKKGMPLPFNDYSFRQEWTDGWVGQVVTESKFIPTSPWYEQQKVTQIYAGNYREQQITMLAESTGLMNPDEQDAVAKMAINNVLTRIKAQKVDLGVIFGERKQTMALVADNAIKIASALTHLKHGDFAGAAGIFTGFGLKKRAKSRFEREYVKPHSRANAIGSAWLELQYGWKPLLSDIHGAMEALASGARPEFQQVKASATITKRIKGSYGITANTRFDEEGADKYTVKYVIRCGQYRPHEATCAQLGILNPLTVAWELMPWSFVIDWFLPVGNYLQNLDATSGLYFSAGCRTTVRKIDSVVVKTYSGSDASWSYSGTISKLLRKAYIDRVVLTDFPVLRFPSFKNPVSTGHFLNAMALLTNLRK